MYSYQLMLYASKGTQNESTIIDRPALIKHDKIELFNQSDHEKTTLFNAFIFKSLRGRSVTLSQGIKKQFHHKHSKSTLQCSLNNT